MIPFTPASLAAASVYQVFVRNFTEKGDLDSAAARLPEIVRLGFDIVYLTPIHPIGAQKRKGSLGSPYAISDYRAVDPALGGENALRRFMDQAHGLGLAVVLDVVYNHTSPDSVLAKEHPEWFWKGADGRPAPRVADWLDVVTLDYSHRALWDYQIETLERWARFGADGFRCDVASLVPLDFWIEARHRLAGVKPLVWIAESVHREFVLSLRRQGYPVASDPEIHRAFDISYDYDGWSELAAAWSGERSLAIYLRHLEVQESMYPAGSLKLRFLENHDQVRAASRFGRGARLRNWTLFAMLLPGTFMAYMGQELGLDGRIGLFELETMDRGAGDEGFRDFFVHAHALSRQVRAEAPVFDARLVSEGVVLVERSSAKAGTAGASLDGIRYAALLNLDGRSGRAALGGPGATGQDLISGRRITWGESIQIERDPLLLRLEGPAS